MLVGLSLFAYNISQSYIFNTLLVDILVRFELINKENGCVISTLYLITAAYIFAGLWLVPWFTEHF
jgi:hypothetical protein